MTSINLLHVSASGRNPLEFYYNKGIQHAKLGIVSFSLD